MWGCGFVQEPLQRVLNRCTNTSLACTWHALKSCTRAHTSQRERELESNNRCGKRGRAKGSQQPASHDIDPWHAPQHGRKTAPGSSPQNPQSDAGPPPIVIVLGSPPTRTFRRWFRCTCDKVHAHGCRRAALASEAPPNFAKEPRILSVQSWKHGSGGLSHWRLASFALLTALAHNLPAGP